MIDPLLRQKVRNVVAKRLHRNMSRRGINLRDLSTRSGVAESVLREYLAAQREIKFDELRPAFGVFGITLMQALAPNGNKKKALDAAQLERLTERGAEAWKDVPDATKWVEELRGN